MIRQIIIGLTLLTGFYTSFAQETIKSGKLARPEKIDSMQAVINDRVKALENIKGDKAKADTLNILANDYYRLSKLWETECRRQIAAIESLRPIFILLSNDESVFNAELPDIAEVPEPLKEHHHMLYRTISARKDIERIEKDIDIKTKACTALNQNPRDIIPGLIADDINVIYQTILEIQKTGLPTFSDIQKQYFKDNIVARFNNFEKYFTND